jgi:tetratricopeptide (TPR) repeat protein
MSHSRRILRALVAGLVVVVSAAAVRAAAQAGPPGQAAVTPPAARPEVVSPLGRSFYAKPDADGAIAKADAALAANPRSLDLLLAAARARDAALQYNDAIALYSRGIAAAPGDVRFLRFRGHRYISTRRFALAIADLEQARVIAPWSFDVLYHLGLAHFLSGNFSKAADVYNACLTSADERPLPDGWRTCASVAGDDDSRVALIEWRYRALRRAGRTDEAAKMLASVTDRMAVKENAAYYSSLLVAKGLKTEAAVLGPDTLKDNAFVTTGYGVASFYLAENKPADACRVLRRIVDDVAHWNGFGYIGAETDLSGPLKGTCR